MTVYYNELDPEACAVLEAAIVEGIIAPGYVDNRSIKEVTADDIRGYTQHHFFAGAGLWSVGCRIAGWPDSRPIWTASCPCQPFSGAGKQAGADDPRHLWPDLYRLLRAARSAGQPVPTLVGEQVAGSLGYHWFDGVRVDLAREEIAARTIDIPACAVDAPHERNRLWWCAVANTQEQFSGAGLRQDRSERYGAQPANRHGRDIVLADAEGFSSGRELAERRPEGRAVDGVADADGGLVDAAGQRRREGSAEAGVLGRRPTAASANVRQRNGSWWADAQRINCHDGKTRRAKPSIPMLVDGMAGRIGLWRLAGNSISPIFAAEVIASILDVEEAMRSAA